MHRHAGYPYQDSAPTTHRYSGTSSAFSPSANPNEDWTKISDLAERRRIQNRIAQRNYRKKLKKRLEDLERRAASSSASPEPQPAELERSSPSKSEDYGSEASIESIERANHVRRTSEMIYNNHYLTPHDDRNLFPDTRQLSTSPPPLFSYSNYPQEPMSYPYSQPAPYQAISTSLPEMQVFSPYLPPLSSNYPTTLPSMVYPAKQDYFSGDEISPFSMSYASMAGIDVPATTSYQDPNAQTPPLSESFDLSYSLSPPESVWNCPGTPESLPGTPPLHFNVN